MINKLGGEEARVMRREGDKMEKELKEVLSVIKGLEEKVRELRFKRETLESWLRNIRRKLIKLEETDGERNSILNGAYQSKRNLISDLRFYQERSSSSLFIGLQGPQDVISHIILDFASILSLTFLMCINNISAYAFM